MKRAKGNLIIRERNLFSLSLLLILLYVLTLTIGYSSYQASLTITDASVIVRADKNVRITSFGVDSVKSGGIINSTDYNVSEVYTDIVLPSPDSEVKYFVEVKNYGNVEMGILGIELPNELKDILEVSFDGYDLGTKIRDNENNCENSINGCKLSIKRNFYMKIKYKEGAYNNNNISFNNVTIKFNFVEAHKVTYTGFTAFNPSMDLKSVLHNGNFSCNIGAYDTLFVKMGGVLIYSYTIDQNNQLTVENVTDDLEIIIVETKAPVKIQTNPSGVDIAYSLNGINQGNYTTPLNKQMPLGSTLDVYLTAYGYKDVHKTYTVDGPIEDNITMDQVYYLNIITDLDDATISYKINGNEQTPVVKTLSGEYDPGTVIDVTITRKNYRTEKLTFTMNNHITQNINMVRQYQYKVNSVNPSDSNIYVSINDGAQTSIMAEETLTLDEGTKIDVTVSRSGYRTKTYTVILNENKSDSITLTKTYIYTVNAIKPTNATLYLTLNNGARQLISNGYSAELDVNTNIKLEASATNHVSKTYEYTLTEDKVENVSLIRLYSYTVSSSNANKATVTINYNNNTYTGTGSKTITVEENKPVSWSIEANYYQTKTGNTTSVSNDVTNNITLDANPSRTDSFTITTAISGNTYLKGVSRTLTPDAKIISATATGTLNNGALSSTENEFYAVTNHNEQFLFKDLSTAGRGKRSVDCSFSSTIPSAPIASSYTVYYGKSGWLYVVTPDIQVTVVYVPKNIND